MESLSGADFEHIMQAAHGCHSPIVQSYSPSDLPPKTGPVVILGKQGGQNGTPEEIIHKLREAEVLLGQGYTVGEAVRQLGIAEQTYYRWRKDYGGLDKSQVRRLKDLERENAQYKKLVADLSLDKVILEEAGICDAGQKSHKPG